MTTKPQPTPYDAEIAQCAKNGARLAMLDKHVEYTALVARREGYLRAKAEDADLLAEALDVVAAARPLLRAYLANAGNPRAEFVACITDDTGAYLAKWRALQAALADMDAKPGKEQT